MSQGFYGGYMGNAGALSNQNQFAQGVPMPYYGGGMNAPQVAQGIPAYQDPRLPMTQEQFLDAVEDVRFKRMFPNPGDFMRRVNEYNRENPLNRQVSIPAGFDGKYVS